MIIRGPAARRRVRSMINKLIMKIIFTYLTLKLISRYSRKSGPEHMAQKNLEKRHNFPRNIT